MGLYALRGENVVDWTGIAAGASIAIVPVICVFIALQKYFCRWYRRSCKELRKSNKGGYIYERKVKRALAAVLAVLMAGS